MPDRIRLRHHPAEGLTEHDRLFDTKRAAEHAYIVTPLRQRPRSWVAGHTAPVPAVIDVDDLSDVGEPVEIAAKTGMIETWAAMHNDQSRLFSHLRSVRLQLRTDNIEEDALTVQIDEHGTPAQSPGEAFTRLDEARLAERQLNREDIDVGIRHTHKIPARQILRRGCG